MTREEQYEAWARGRKKGLVTRQKRAAVRARELAVKVAHMEIIENQGHIEIAKALGIAEKTYFNWRSNHKAELHEAYEKVAHRVDQSRVMAILRLRERMAKLAGKAADTIDGSMDAKHEGTRLKAAQATLEYLDPRKGASGAIVGSILSAKASDLIAAALVEEPEIRAEAEILGEGEGGTPGGLLVGGDSEAVPVGVGQTETDADHEADVSEGVAGDG